MILKLAAALTLLIIANAQQFGDRLGPRLISTIAPQLRSTFAPQQFSELNERPYYSFPFNIGSTVIPFGVRFGNAGNFGVSAFRSATLPPSPLPLATVETSSELPEVTISLPTEPTLPISSLESTPTPFIPSVAPDARFSPFVSAAPFYPSPTPFFASRLSPLSPSRFSPFASAAPFFPSPAPSFASRFSTIPLSRSSPFTTAAPIFPSPAPSSALRFSGIPPSRFSPFASAAPFLPSPAPSFAPRFSALPPSDIPFKVAPEEKGPAEYHFQYDIQVPETGDFKSQDETRHYDSVKGTYSLVQPDGLLRIVEYTADDASGFNAIVRYEDAGLGRFGPGVSSTEGPFIKK